MEQSICHSEAIYKSLLKNHFCEALTKIALKHIMTILIVTVTREKRRSSLMSVPLIVQPSRIFSITESGTAGNWSPRFGRL